MPSMTTTSTATQYHDLFEVEASTFPIAVLAASVLIAVILGVSIYLFLSKRGSEAVLMLLVILIMGLAWSVAGNQTSKQHELLKLQNSNANMELKYGATILAGVDGVNREELDKPDEVALHFTDQTEGLYLVTFDRETSEPVILEHLEDIEGSAPTVEELNEKADSK